MKHLIKIINLVAINCPVGKNGLITTRVARFGLLRQKNDKFGLFYIGWPGHFL